MKIKQQLHISNPEAFMRGDYSYCFSLFNFAVSDDSTYIHVGEIELDVNVDKEDCVDAIITTLDEEIGKHTAALNVLEQKKAELLALPAPDKDDE